MVALKILEIVIRLEELTCVVKNEYSWWVEQRSLGTCPHLLVSLMMESKKKVLEIFRTCKEYTPSLCH